MSRQRKSPVMHHEGGQNAAPTGEKIARTFWVLVSATLTLVLGYGSCVFATYGYPVQAGVVALVTLVAAWSLPIHPRGRWAGCLAASFAALLFFSAQRSVAYQRKMAQLMVTAEDIMRDQAGTPRDQASLDERAERWRRWAKSTPAYQVSVHRNEEGIQSMAISTGWLHWWEVSRVWHPEPLPEGATPELVWRAVGDDAEVVQRELDAYLRRFDRAGVEPEPWLGR